jgi:hypothetical protein
MKDEEWREFRARPYGGNRARTQYRGAQRGGSPPLPASPSKKLRPCADRHTRRNSTLFRQADFIAGSSSKFESPPTPAGPIIGKTAVKLLEETTMKSTFAFAAGLVALSTAFTAAPAMAWDQVGERVVTDRLDVDVINLPGNRKFSRLKVCVYDNPVHFYDFDVFFRNGGHQDVSVRARINPGECTRNIDLKGGQRNIDRIKFKYEETSWFIGRATVRVFAE